MCLARLVSAGARRDLELDVTRRGWSAPRRARTCKRASAADTHRRRRRPATFVAGGGWLGGEFQPYWGDGLDLGTYVRAATQNYVLGGFGLALDAGGYVRTFASKSGGLLGAFNVGLPWGVVASVTYARGPDGVQTIGGTLGLDFLRLTVYRLAGEQEWANVRPAWRP